MIYILQFLVGFLKATSAMVCFSRIFRFRGPPYSWAGALNCPSNRNPKLSRDTRG